MYGTVNGRPAVLTTGTPAVLPDGTLTPTGTGGRFLPVLSQGRLYALLPPAPHESPSSRQLDRRLSPSTEPHQPCPRPRGTAVP